jgi:integrase
MPQKFTDRFIAGLKPPPSGRLEIVDSEAPGLTLRVTHTGEKSWAVRYRPGKGTDQRRATIGVYPGLSLADARTKAYEIAAKAQRGIDPLAEEKRAREIQKIIAAQPQSVKELNAKYIAEYAKTNMRKWQQCERVFQMHVDPKIGKLALGDVRRGDVVTLLDDMQNKKGLGAQVNRTRGLIIAAFNWAVEREFMLANPAASVRKRKLEHSRTRVLTDNELRSIWKAALKIGYPGGDFVRALMLCCQRRNEVQKMPRAEIKDETDWIIPAARNKGKRDHMIPLSPALRDLIKATPESGPYVFSADGENPYAGEVRLKRILDQECGVSDWIFHDIRRTVNTRLAELGVPLEVRQHLLNHARPKLDQVYNLYEFRVEKRKALEAWSERLAWIVSDDRDAKVVPIRR